MLIPHIPLDLKKCEVSALIAPMKRTGSRTGSTVPRQGDLQGLADAVSKAQQIVQLSAQIEKLRGEIEPYRDALVVISPQLFTTTSTQSSSSSQSAASVAGLGTSQNRLSRLGAAAASSSALANTTDAAEMTQLRSAVAAAKEKCKELEGELASEKEAAKKLKKDLASAASAADAAAEQYKRRVKALEEELETTNESIRSHQALQPHWHRLNAMADMYQAGQRREDEARAAGKLQQKNMQPPKRERELSDVLDSTSAPVSKASRGEQHLVSVVKTEAASTSRKPVPKGRRKSTPRTPSTTNADRAHGEAGAPPSAKLYAADSGALSTQPQRKFSPLPTFPTNPPRRPPAALHASTATARSGANSRPEPSSKSTTDGPVSKSNSAFRPTGMAATRSPTPVNPTRGPVMERRFILTGLSESEAQRCSAAILQIGQMAQLVASQQEEPPPMSVTHVVVRGMPRSLRALCGVVSGKWIVSPEYIYDSLSSGFWLDERDEGALRCYPPPLLHHRFLVSIDSEGTRSRIEQVIEYGGGEIVKGSGRVADGVIVIKSGDELLTLAMSPPTD